MIHSTAVVSTNAKIAKDIIDNSGLNVLSAIEFQEAADKVQEALS